MLQAAASSRRLQYNSADVTAPGQPSVDHILHVCGSLHTPGNQSSVPAQDYATKSRTRQVQLWHVTFAIEGGPTQTLEGSGLRLHADSLMNTPESGHSIIHQCFRILNVDGWIAAWDRHVIG